MLDNISSSFTSAFKKLRGKGKLSVSDVESVLSDIRTALIESDVAVSVVDEFLDEIRVKTASIEKSKSITPSEQIIKAINDELQDILGRDVDRKLTRAKNGPTVYMLVGLQGAGKTSLAGKLGYWLKQNGHTPLLVAADLQRPGAVQQLEIVGADAAVPVFAPNPGIDVNGEVIQKQSGLSKLFSGRDSSKEPIRVAEQAIVEAKQKLYDTVIIDTAGRLGIDEELISQAKGIKNAVNPDEVFFVMDGSTGQDAVNSAQAFNQGVGFTASVLTKMDSDTAGGAALSLAKVTGLPILLQSVGEKFSDLEVFHPDRIAGRILDQGDILTLLEQAEAKIDEAAVEKSVQKLIEGEDFDLNDFLEQMNQVKNMGSIKNMLSMIPGMSQHKQAIDNFDESEITRIEAMIQSMTPYERANPKQINGSRKQRIARGFGGEVSSINIMLQRFTQTQKMMKKMMGGKKGKNLLKGLSSSNGISDSIDSLGDGSNSKFDMSALGSSLGGNLAANSSGFATGGPDINSMMNSLMGSSATSAKSNRKKNKNKKQKGRSGNPAKRAQEEALMRAKLGLN